MITQELFELCERYAIMDDEGNWVGISDDAPPEARKDLEALKKLQDEGMDAI
jgi:hypothetical protein